MSGFARLGNLTESDSDSDAENTPPTKKQRVLCDYVHVRDFGSLVAAKQHMKKDGKYNYVVKRESMEGVKIFYHCKYAACRLKAYLQLQENSTTVSFFEADGHFHAEQKSKPGIPSNIKEEVNRLYNGGITKPKLIVAELRRQNIPEPSISQLRNFLKFKKAKSVPNIVSLGQLAEICDRNKNPAFSNDPYVVATEFSKPEEPLGFRFFMSTPRLMGIAEGAQSIQADSTYKLLWEGFPVLVVGTSDRDRQFHPFGIAVCSSDSEKDFGFIFRTLKSKVKNLNPKILIADCAAEITNGFTKAFGLDISRVHCWFHVAKKLKEKLNVTVDAKTKADILEDIRILQVQPNEGDFNTALNLFMKKWSPKENTKEFLTYFTDEYLNQRSGWYEGIAPGFPSTNNGLESLNNKIKEEGTLRRRLPLGEFFTCIAKLIKDWSMDRDPDSPNFKPFVTRPTLHTHLLSQAYEFAKLRGKTVLTNRVNANEVNHFIPSQKQKQLTENDIKDFRKKRAKFDTLKQWRSRLDVVQLNEGNWKDSRCTCSIFQKEYLCKHLIGIAALKGLYQFPDNAKTDLIGKRRKPGRPRKVNHALLIA